MSYFAKQQNQLNEIKAILIEKREVAKNRMAFLFDTKDTGYKFRAGQYAHFTIPFPSLDDRKGNTRPMSIANAPSNNGSIMIVVRIGESAFSQNLMALKTDEEILVSEPKGELKLPADKNIPVVLIAGGTGITPVRGFVEEEISGNSGRNMLVIYGNRNQEEAAFMEEFLKWEKLNSNLKFVPVFEDTANAEWNYEEGLITNEILKKHIENIEDNFYLIIGPAGMVESVTAILSSAGVKEENILVERFS